MTKPVEEYHRVIKTRQDRVHAANAVAHLGSEPVMEVIIRPYKKNRTNAQNRLMWMWHGQYAAEFGETKEDTHDRYKERHVLPVLMARDTDEGERLRELEMICNVSPTARQTLIDLISTTMLDTKEFSDALTEYSQTVAREQGLAFTHPEDLYYQAMGQVA